VINARRQAIKSANQRLARNFPVAVNNAEHRDHVIGRDVTVDDNVRRDNADANTRPESWTRRAALGMTGQTIVELCKAISEFGSDLMAALAFISLRMAAESAAAEVVNLTRAIKI
jgi:hypothetical protein